MNLGFVDGNKRVGWAAAELFLQLNGTDISVDNRQAERFIYSQLDAGTFNKDVIAAWLNANSGPFDPNF